MFKEMRFKLKDKDIYGVPDLVIGEVYDLKHVIKENREMNIVAELLGIYSYNLCFQNVVNKMVFCVSMNDIVCGAYRFRKERAYADQK